MPSNLASRTIVAGGIFLALLALFFTFPAIMAGDMDAFADLLKIGGAMSFALLVGVLILVLPLLIIFGAIRIDTWGARLPMALAGGIAGFVLALYGLGGQSGDLLGAGRPAHHAWRRDRGMGLRRAQAGQRGLGAGRARAWRRGCAQGPGCGCSKDEYCWGFGPPQLHRGLRFSICTKAD